MARKGYERPSLKPGRLLLGEQGRYRILKKRGGGAQGLVYRAEKIDTRELVAVKLFSPRDPLSRPRWRSECVRFKNEFKKLHSVIHWNILRATDRGTTQLKGVNVPFAVTEYLPATLGDVLKRSSAGLLRRYSYCAQLSDAIGYLNLRGHTIHRDLKPANILVDRNHVLKVSDLGVAIVKQTRHPVDLYAEKTDPLQHPRFYLTPEQLALAMNPSAYPTPESRYAKLEQSDLFQLGRVCHEILTGVNPIGQLDWASRVHEQLPRYLRTVLQRLLSGESESRLSSDAASEIFHTTFTAYLYYCLRKAERIPSRLQDCLARYFKKNNVVTIKKKWKSDPLASFSYPSYPEGPAPREFGDLCDLGILRPRYDRVTDKFELTALGTDVRDILTKNTAWTRLVGVHSNLHRLPHPMYVDRSDRVLRRPWTQWKPNPYGRHIREFAKISKPEDLRLYVLPPRKTGNRWYVEILGARAKQQVWRGYGPPLLVLDGQTRTSTRERLQKRWPDLALSALKGFSFQSRFYVSLSYLRMRPDAVFADLTREGAATVLLVVQPCLGGTKLGDIDVGLDWILFERCELVGFRNGVPRRAAEDICQKVLRLVRKRAMKLEDEDAGREVNRVNGIAGNVGDVLTESNIAASERDLRSLLSILIFFFKSFRLTIRRRRTGWDLCVEPQEVASRSGAEVMRVRGYRPQPVEQRFAAEYPLV